MESGALLESQVVVIKPGALRLCPWGLNDLSGHSLAPLAAREPGVDFAPRLGARPAPSQREGNSSPVGRSFPQDKSLVGSYVLFSFSVCFYLFLAD